MDPNTPPPLLSKKNTRILPPSNPPSSVLYLSTPTETPMLEDADEGGVRLWHLVKASEEPELPKHRRGSLRERERAKAIPEIYLTRLLSMKVGKHAHTTQYTCPHACKDTHGHTDTAESLSSTSRL